ncbi:MAG: beta-lactamase family protein, partial [Paludibacteraceae bacterium]|nr:beta-lactamase family protein [Paludibacteraceae bacterium]
MKINQFMWVLAASMLLTSCAMTQEERINNAIKQVMDQYQCVGVSAAVVQDGQIVYNQSFGYKDLETQTPLANDHMMRIASISKSFTATGLMQHVEKGIISLDDDINDLI